MSKIFKLVSDLAQDGHAAFGLFAPLLSIAYTLLKFFDLETPARDMLREMSYGWALLPITIWFGVAYYRRHSAFEELFSRCEQAAFAPDMNPKDAIQHICERSTWSEQFDDRRSLFEAAQMALRDELVSGLRVRAKGRDSGTWGNGSFRHPSYLIDPTWWKHGDLNWIKILNLDYRGHIDAHDRGYETGKKQTLDDVMLCRRQIENVWPPKTRFRQWWSPPKFQIFEKLTTSAPPWSKPRVDELREPVADIDRPLQKTEK